MKKDTNPKQLYGDTKVGLSNVPLGPLYALAVAMTEGAMKYGRHNYRDMGCRHSTYFDAATGHLASWFEGEDIDPDSGMHHLIKAAACCIVMYDSILMLNDNDDRPIQYPKNVPLRINDAIKSLQEKYPNPERPFIQKDYHKQEQRTVNEPTDGVVIPMICGTCKHRALPPSDRLCAECLGQRDRKNWEPRND